MTAHERTGWRDQPMSDRHRKWGQNCPMVDIDFLVVEYDYCVPIALIEYKNERAEIKEDANYKTLIRLGNMSRLPLFRVQYANTFEWWQVESLNGFAEHHLSAQTKMTERQYVTFLYKLRGRKLPKWLFDGEKLRGVA